MTAFATIHEYKAFSPRLAQITASFVERALTQDQAFDALKARLGDSATPVRGSFRWIDGEDRTQVVGFVYAHRETKFCPEGKIPQNYRAVAANIYMDDADKSMWDMREGAGGKYLARQGQEDLKAMLEKARVSPRGSQPRMEKILSCVIGEKDFVSFVSENRRGAEMDHGIVLGTGSNGALMVLSHLTTQPVQVSADVVVSSWTLNHEGVPPLPKEKIKAMKAMRPKPVTAAARVKAADVYDPYLTPQEYWTLQYSYNQEYLNKVLQQVAEMAAL